MARKVYKQMLERAQDPTTPTDELERLGLCYPGLAHAVLANPNLALKSTIAILRDRLSFPPNPALALAVIQNTSFLLHCISDREQSEAVWSLALKVGDATRAGSLAVVSNLSWADRHLLIKPYERTVAMVDAFDPRSASIRANKAADPTSAINLLRHLDATIPSRPWRDPRFCLTGVILEYASENGSPEELTLGVELFDQLASAGVRPPALWQAVIDFLR